jgi:soluble epoxide hydrolase/lipid-phosphate phosphatase
MLGYGGTDKPWDATEYTTKHLCGDLAALLDLIGVHKAVCVGQTALRHLWLFSLHSERS